MKNTPVRATEQNIIDLYVGRRLKLLRSQRKISQKELARRLDITFQQVQKYEKGLNRLPASRMLMICFALAVSPNDLFKDLLTNEYPPTAPEDYSTQDVEILEMLRGLSTPSKNHVRQIVGALVRQ